jgi:spermidine/putrescine transport system permease protein
LGLTTIFIAHTTFNIPFVLFIILSRLEEFDYSIVEAAYDLGATEWQALTKVIIPAILPGIISGFLIAVTLSFDDFVTTFFVAGPGSSTLPLRIYSMIRLGVSPVINALSVLLIGISIILTLSTKSLQKYLIK